MDKVTFNFVIFVVSLSYKASAIPAVPNILTIP